MVNHIFEKLVPYRVASKYSEFREVTNTFDNNLDWERAWFDVKLQTLDKGECPCRPIWHYDGSNNPFEAPEVKYALYLSGDCICPTKFFTIEPEVEGLGDESLIHKFAKEAELANETYSLNYEQNHFYTSRNLHTATLAKNSGQRLIIRAKFGKRY